jgi:hypothetical protein
LPVRLMAWRLGVCALVGKDLNLLSAHPTLGDPDTEIMFYSGDLCGPTPSVPVYLDSALPLLDLCSSELHVRARRICVAK